MGPGPAPTTVPVVLFQCSAEANDEPCWDSVESGEAVEGGEPGAPAEVVTAPGCAVEERVLLAGGWDDEEAEQIQEVVVLGIPEEEVEARCVVAALEMGRVGPAETVPVDFVHE